ncbi:MAG: TonB-dependent receptor [Muribaculum sp.]|nr:TonB-dependent receptor [Muribaculum sp.]
MIKRLYMALAAGFSLTAFSAPVSSEWSDTTLNLNEVSVTAIKLSDKVDRLPVASTVIDRRQVERLNIVTMKSVSEIAPNFFIPDYGSRMTSSIYVRGIGARIDQPVVGLNIDNVPYLNKDNYDFDLPDIERIEVLRGPQSTLYGRNTMGGLVNIYTLSPMNYQGIRALAEYGTANTVRASVGAYEKLTDDLGMSLSAYFTHTDGFFRNLYNGKKVDKENQGTLRWKTVWNPSSGLSIENVASLQIARQGGYPYQFIETGEINYNDTCYYRRNSVSDGLTVNWRVGNVNLSSITSFQYIDDDMTLDQDFLPKDYFTLTQARKEWAFTQDFIGRGSVGAYSWLGGLFGFYKKAKMDAPVTFKQEGISDIITGNVNSNEKIPIKLQWDDDHLLLDSHFDNPVYGAAFYHQSSLNLGRWNLSVGLRLDIEHNKLDYNSLCDTHFSILPKSPAIPIPPMNNLPVNIDESGHLSRTFVELLPKFTATYAWSDVSGNNVYASVAKGYKAGGYNTQMFSNVLQQKLMQEMMKFMPSMGGRADDEGSDPESTADDVVSYKPEYSYNYELGAHVATADGRFNGQLALFYIDCRDQQLTKFPDNGGTGRMMTNAGKTRSFGVELSARYAPAQRWLFNASYGYTNAKFRKYDDGHDDWAGKYIPYAPQHTMFVGATYTQPLRASWADKLVFNVNCRGVGQIYWNEENTVKQPFYSLIGASISLEHKNYSLILWCENLADANYDTFYFVSINNAFLQRGKKRQTGITLRFNI